ncbi:probable ATP-dependent RNA helicase DDX43 [Calliphora vicina]|uniref:probable ATP-dependent RNA helicase DDX43 n=1 Tax=Calliphora vicina TaxID=7373 RepID=UPI00325AFC57
MSDWEEDDNCSSAVQTHEQDLNLSGGRRSPASSSRWGQDKRNDDFGNRREQRGRDGGRGGNASRNFEFKETIDLRSDCIGMIIGRGGSNIQRLQTDYNVRVDLDKGSGTATVSGNSEGDVQSALNSIKDQMEKSENRGGGGGRGNGGTNGGGYRDRGNSYQSRYNEPSENSDSYGRGGSGGGGNYRKPDNDFYSGGGGTTFQEESSEDNGGIIDWKSLNEKAEVARKKRWAMCPTLTKNFYQETPEVASLSNDEAQRIRLENNNTTVARVFKGEEGDCDKIPNPVWKFEQCFAAYPDLLAEIRKQDFKKPSPIQAQAWPILLKGEDMIGIAQTGTGKTLAFLLPAMIHTEYQSLPRSERGGPNVLIMAPTRELALQIEKEVNKYQFRGMRAVCVYGGGNRRDQIGCVESGAEIIICTPGRLNDLIQAKVIDVATITYLVLDEADRMLDMGFEPQIRKILLDIRPDRQTVMTSATWPAGVRRLAQSYMNNPIQVCVGSLDLAATHTVEQIIEIMEEEDKFYTAKRFIKNMKPDDKIIIFCGKKVRADDLSSDLTLDGYMCQCIHGSRDQADREQAIADITSGEVKILIATDVASRGLDIEDITHVINFDFPRNIEEYVHRVGRTGRAGRTGTSISYITRSDWGMAPELISILEEANQHVPDELRDMAERFAKMKERKNEEMGKFNNMRGPRGGGYGGRSGGGGGGGGRGGRRY